MILTDGIRYDLAKLTLVDWTKGDGSGHDGYDCWSYFDLAGRYLGPDKHGIEPVFELQS